MNRQGNSRTPVKIYGERNTSTNYLRHLLLENLDVAVLGGTVPSRVMKLQHLLPGNELVRDSFFGLTYRRNLGWKHRRPQHSKRIALRREGRNPPIITVTKNPYAWFLSMHRRPYHVSHAVSRDIEQFLATPLPTLRRENCGRRSLTPIDLWNVKNRAYTQLPTSACLNTTTEALLDDPEKVIRTFESQFDLNGKSATFVNHESSTKEAGKDFAFYRQYYLEERWRDEISAPVLAIASDGLDRDLMDAFGYEVLA